HCLVVPRLILSDALAPAALYTLSLHDALPISTAQISIFLRSFSFNWLKKIKVFHKIRLIIRREAKMKPHRVSNLLRNIKDVFSRSEEHTSELQSRENIVCRLLLEKKKTNPCTQ